MVKSLGTELVISSRYFILPSFSLFFFFSFCLFLCYWFSPLKVLEPYSKYHFLLCSWSSPICNTILIPTPCCFHSRTQEKLISKTCGIFIFKIQLLFACNHNSDEVNPCGNLRIFLFRVRPGPILSLPVFFLTAAYIRWFSSVLCLNLNPSYLEACSSLGLQSKMNSGYIYWSFPPKYNQNLKPKSRLYLRLIQDQIYLGFLLKSDQVQTRFSSLI